MKLEVLTEEDFEKYSLLWCDIMLSRTKFANIPEKLSSSFYEVQLIFIEGGNLSFRKRLKISTILDHVTHHKAALLIYEAPFFRLGVNLYERGFYKKKEFQIRVLCNMLGFMIIFILYEKVTYTQKLPFYLNDVRKTKIFYSVHWL